MSYKIFPAHMGGQKGIAHFYEHLQQHHSIRMVVSNDNATGSTGYPVEPILFANHRMGWNLLRLGKLRKIIKKHRVDAIIAEHSYTGWIGWLLKKWTGVPFMIHSHNIEASRFRQMGKRVWKAYLNYERWIHRKGDFSFFKTEEEKSFALRSFSLPPAKCAVIPYGIKKIRRVANAEQELRQQYGIKNRYIFYFNGTLDYAPNQQAVERLIDNINPQLKKAGIDFIILISGKHLPSLLCKKIETAETIRYLQFVKDVDLLY
ncbi:MAG: glycosyltransferase, partial [Bacteroidota bacterium]|nr:glycosyltransferase [Bacteroidota bacterium]